MVKSAFARHRDFDKNAQAITPEEIEAMARPHYPDSGSHGWNHIQGVLESARRMRRKELLKKELAALMYHDSSLLTGPRETHAEDSAEIARKELSGKFSRRQLEDIANAIAHHRASYEGKRKSRLENLVAAADRDVFVDGNVDDYILRSYRYGLEHGMTPDEAVANTLHHMPDKYGTNGYAYKNVPKIYMDTYGDEVRKAQKAFDSMTADRISELAKSAQSYEPPWTIDRIRKEYGDDVADRLAKDPVHKWRSDTGIELIHKEPNEDELRRIIANWRLMDAVKKRRSNRMSKKLFGKTNLQHADELLKAERLAKARKFVEDVRRMALKRKLNYFLVTDGASGVANDGNPAVRNAREAQIKWELEHGEDPYEDWSKEAESKPMSPKELKRLYSLLKYRILNQKTNRPYFNTNFETFDNWHLLSPEQVKKHRIGICYDTAAMTDSELSRLGIPHENYFAHSRTDGDWTNDPTHAFNVYKDEDGNWRWLEGSWGPYKDNDWSEREKRRLVRRIVKELRKASGKRQVLHSVDKFPEPGISMADWYDEMTKHPVKKAQAQSQGNPPESQQQTQQTQAQPRQEQAQTRTQTQVQQPQADGQAVQANCNTFFGWNPDVNPALRSDPRYEPDVTGLVPVDNPNWAMRQVDRFGVPLLKKLTVFGTKPGFFYSTTF